MENLLNKIKCPNCKRKFEDNKNYPIILNCGHTICKTWLLGILNINSNKKCPFDKSDLHSNNINEYKINTQY